MTAPSRASAWVGSFPRPSQPTTTSRRSHILSRISFFFAGHESFEPTTSWAGQEALTATISQYHTQFLEFGSEILTRGLEQAEQHLTSRMQRKKKSCPPTAGPKFLLKLEAGKSAKKKLHLTRNVLFSVIQITCQNFRSKLQKLGVILRFF